MSFVKKQSSLLLQKKSVFLCLFFYIDTKVDTIFPVISLLRNRQFKVIITGTCSRSGNCAVIYDKAF